MLSNLYIENVAVIEKANIDFSDGFNVLTGETGAGKSIVIDSINAVLGNRTSKQIIRHGASSALVSATFYDIDDMVKRKARSLGYEIEDDCLILQRELSASGRNTCRINSRPAPVSVLKELGTYLIGIHGQNDNLELVSPALHMHYIDSLCRFGTEMQEYRNVYRKLKKTEEELEGFNLDEQKRLEEIELLTYQIDEIDNADLKIGEEDSLSEERSVLLNSEKILDSLISARNILDGGDDMDFGVISALDDAQSDMIKASSYFSDVEGLADRISNAYYELQDISAEISSKIDDVGLDPDRLNEIEERLDLIFKLKRKYGQSEEDILSFCEDARKRLSVLVNYADNREALREEYTKLMAQALKQAEHLSNVRKETSAKFAQEVQSEMAFLEMPNVKLVIEQEKTELGPKGFDRIEFLFSVNPGEDPKPVAKIASGGELSRMMLAIKTVLAKDDFIGTLIFDEIDTGISGSAAQRVGQKLRQISKDKQIMCVTHQAQIAALCDNHLLIKKTYKDDRTYTTVEGLDREGRIRELARIIDGVEVTDTAIEHAKSLIAQ